jgi:carbonic anhydrase
LKTIAAARGPLKGETAMCINCSKEGIGRRDFIKFSAAGAVALGLGGMSARAHAAEAAPTALSPAEALAQLKAGNKDFVTHPELCSVNLSESRSAVAGHQAPWATIVSCADSRVPPELIFGGHGVGELFISRDAGNLVNVDSLGTIEYGAAVLGSPLVVVLAHTACGAVKAACDVVTKNATYPGVIGRMIAPIVPAALAVRDQPGDFVDNAAKESARRTAKLLTAVSPLMADLAKDGKVKTLGAIYDLETGAVTFLD